MKNLSRNALKCVIIILESFLLLYYLIKVTFGAKFKRERQVCPYCGRWMIVYGKGEYEDVNFHICNYGSLRGKNTALYRVKKGD